MKDGYNFDVDKADALHAYNRHLVSYLRTYERMGLQGDSDARRQWPDWRR